MKNETLLDPDRALLEIEAIRLTHRSDRVPIMEACGRVLAEPIRARIDSPPFAKAAMDGFAVRGDDKAARYRLVETVAAGDVPQKAIDAGECCKIMTGAMMPRGADKVIRVEYTLEEAGRVTVTEPEPRGNVIARGENMRAGESLLGPKVLTAQDVGVLASQGIDSVQVAEAPLVGIIATGNELCNGGAELEPGQIYNSNGPQLCAQVASMHGRYRYHGSVTDDRDKLAKVIDGALQECDIILLSGGVSMGELDFVPDVLTRFGAAIRFHKLAIKPGKPTLFAQKEDKFIFGLPGNPVSTFVIFEVFVKPFLYRWMGIQYSPRLVRGVLSAAIQRRDAERLEFRPVYLRGEVVHPLTYHGSSHLSALREAEGMIRIERGVAVLQEGAELDVRLF